MIRSLESRFCTAMCGVACVLVCLIGFPSTGFARTWSDDSGKFSIEAELVSVENNEVTLKRPDGKLVHLPVDKLSKADQDFLAKKSTTSPGTPSVAPITTPVVTPPATSEPGDAPATKRVNLKRDAKEIEKTEQAVNDLYKADLAGAKTPQQRADLARKLIQISDSEPSPEVKYVLARKGAELAAAAGNTQATFAAMVVVEGIVDDPLPVWIDCLENLLAHNPDDLAPPYEKIESLIPDLLAKDNFAGAAKLATMLGAAARLSKDPGQIAAAKIKAGEVATAKDESRKFATAQDQLKQNPADPAAKAIAGRFLCLVRHDWEHGLPLLNDSNDKVLQPIAAAELKANKTPAELAALGDSWMAAVKKVPLHLAAHDRGVYWYQQALPLATGLTKIKLEKELTGHETKVGMDLISKFDIQRDIISGAWALEGHMITCRMPSGIPKIKFQTPADMTHYQLLVEYTNASRTGGLHITFPVGKRATSLVLEASRGCDGLETVNGMNTFSQTNPTLSRPSTMVVNQRTAALIDVLVKENNAEINVQSNGRRTISWKGSVDQLGYFYSWGPPQRETIGISLADGIFAIHNVRLSVIKAAAPPGEASH